MTYGRRKRERRGHDAREKARKFLIRREGNPPQKPTPSAASLKLQHEKGPSLPCSCRTHLTYLGSDNRLMGRLCRLGRHGGKRPWDIGNILRRGNRAEIPTQPALSDLQTRAFDRKNADDRGSSTSRRGLICRPLRLVPKAPPALSGK